MEWTLTYEDFAPSQQGLREALCTLGNGHFATRGAGEECVADDVHYPGTYLAGCYDRLRTELEGRSVENEDLVNLPNWLPLGFRPEGGEWLDLRRVEIRDFRQTLDLWRGLLLREIRVRDDAGRETTLRSRRLVHMGDPHVAAQEMSIVAHNWSGRAEIGSLIDGSVTNAGVPRYRRLNGDHLRVRALGAVGEDAVWLKAETVQSHVRIAEAARTRVFQGNRRIERERRLVEEPARVGTHVVFDLEEEVPVRVEKLVTLFSSRARAISEEGLAAREHVQELPGFDDLLASHAHAWTHLWRVCDLDLVDGGRAARSYEQMVLRLHIFHLLQTTSMNTTDLDAGVPARGLHGEAYRGHIFWDELFIIPLLNVRVPEVTRALLSYRYRRLNAARRNAAPAGFEGALYPWQSGSDGREESQALHLNPRSGRWVPDHSHLQRHVNAAIAYNVWSYYEATADTEFLVCFGAEMILEIARFFASAAIWNPVEDRYEIRGVMGPDEYHDAYPGGDVPGLDNNAYTNVMAVWVLAKALEIVEDLDDEHRHILTQWLQLTPMELDRWHEVSTRMKVCFHEDGIISQFEGYERLLEFDWEGYRKRYGDIQRLDRILEAEDDTPNRYKVSKQADVLMLFYLFSAEQLQSLFGRLGYTFDPATIPDQVQYYLNRTSHGSTLSNVVHSWVLARGKRSAAWPLFRRALESDVADVQGGTTQEGIHLGAMAGTVDLVQRAFAGLEPSGGVLWLDPWLPDELPRLRFRIRYRGNTLALDVDHERVAVTAVRGSGAPLKLGFAGQIYALCPGDSRTFELTAR